MMLSGAEVQDRPTEQPPLHPGLHQQRQVAERLRLEAGNRGADLAVATELLRKEQPRAWRRRELARLGEHALAMLVGRRVVDGREQWPSQHAPDVVTDPRPTAVEQD